MSTVAVGLSTGETIQVQGEYESIKAYLATTGRREVVTTEGLRETIETSTVIRIREIAEGASEYSSRIGFQA